MKKEMGIFRAKNDRKTQFCSFFKENEGTNDNSPEATNGNSEIQKERTQGRPDRGWRRGNLFGVHVVSANGIQLLGLENRNEEDFIWLYLG
ncbi:hypothetical protein CDAR_518861 [Caerostris darwini]|uniref:Uncharacterized protein n=1 Tax=Caerostris darwini TaxID=1538125 RepID=A0AAV4PN69_9ARAC|nr:hypothetical protein CDAR_518861 [Caerostris darwini]